MLLRIHPLPSPEAVSAPRKHPPRLHGSHPPWPRASLHTHNQLDVLCQVFGAPGEEVREGCLPRQETVLVTRSSPKQVSRNLGIHLQTSAAERCKQPPCLLTGRICPLLSLSQNNLTHSSCYFTYQNHQGTFSALVFPCQPSPGFRQGVARWVSSSKSLETRDKLSLNLP